MKLAKTRRNSVGHFTGLNDSLVGRSPSWVWGKLQGSAAPTRPTWGQLLGRWTDAFPADVRAALTQHSTPTDLCLATWNVSWFVNLTTEVAAAKRRIIDDLLTRGVVVCTQETHWRHPDAVIARLGFLCAASFYSAATDEAPGAPARPAGDNAPRRLGGVATFLPPGNTFVDDLCRELVPGHAIYTTHIDRMGHKHSIINVYLRPENPAQTWNAVLNAVHNVIHEDPP